MNILATFGEKDPSIHYADRPTVKVVIKHNDTILLLNRGLLPGGGVDDDESDGDAITRELQEELGVTVKDVNEIGTVVQYRNFLSKKYIINGYTATLGATDGDTNPQDIGEAHFTKQWLAIDDALAYVSESISQAALQPMSDDARQGSLYNLQTTYELIKAIAQIR